MLVVVGVEIVDGKPQLGEHLLERIDISGHDTYTVSWDEHALTMRKVGRVGGKLWFIGHGSKQILQGLSHLGADIKRAKDLTPAQRQALIDAGVEPVRRVSDDQIVGLKPLVVFAGQAPLALSTEDLPEGEYY